jgi:DNA-binding IclR family transcriptional regulator
MDGRDRQRPNRSRRGGGKPAAGAPGRSPKGGKAAPATPTRSRGLDRAVEVFQLLHTLRKPTTVGEIARRLKAPRSTIYEIVNLFRAADMLETAGNGPAVFFGRAVYLYANDYFATHATLRLGQEEVRRLASLTGETCQLCMPVGNKYAVVAMEHSPRLFRIGSDVGVLVPIPWTASGRFFVAHMSRDELAAFMTAG